MRQHNMFEIMNTELGIVKEDSVILVTSEEVSAFVRNFREGQYNLPDMSSRMIMIVFSVQIRRIM